MSILNEVITFAEGIELLGKGRTYLNDLATAGRIAEYVHYRNAGRIKLIKKETVLKLKGDIGMRYFKNIDTDSILSEIEHEALIVREAKELWNVESEELMDIVVFDFKDNGKTEEEYINYMLEDGYCDFVECDREGNKIEC